MKDIKLSENERAAILRFKEVLTEKYNILDFCIFGSKARGDASPESDIDIMIEIEDYRPEIESKIRDIAFEINLDHDCLITTTIFSKKELEEGPLSESPLYKTIEMEGMRV
ncbi:MAG: nucleotidyltransferase domain-containing protein [Thermodesulfovibrionales bacterium]|nr:nucleotidyltransferase domain-containing protein [Thermodesulfovibrionales bacterium]